MVIGKYRITQRGYVVFGATGILLVLLIGTQVKQLIMPMPAGTNTGTGSQVEQVQNTSGSNGSGNNNPSGTNQNAGQGNISESLSVEEKNKIMATAQCIVYFKPDAYDLDDAFYGELDDVVEMSKRFKDSKIVIDGHFNGVPGQKTTEFRVSLAQNRGEMVEAYLISQGVDSDRIIVNNLGCSVPVNKDESWKEIEKNRRVEVYFKTQE